MKAKHLCQFVWVGLLVGLLGALLSASAGASAQQRAPTPANSQPVVQLISEEPYYVLGEPCGAGELLPEWTLCLHGGIALRDAASQPVWLNNIPLTITRGISAVTGVTFIHPGYTTPTYGIDISPLWPEFLEPVTLTANISGTLVERQLIIYPDFRTQNQRFDIVFQDISALAPAPLWGYVADLAARGPVTDATVTAEHNGARVTVTTSVALSETVPFYALTNAHLTMLGAVPGDALTLTTAYQNDTDRQVIVLTDAPQQVNFVTGWKCAGFDPLPRSSGGEGMPRSSGGEGMPNLGCFWGYTVVDGQPRAGVQVRLEINSAVYAGVTQVYTGETQPRYGIAVAGGQSLQGLPLTATAVYSGFTAARQVTVTLYAAQSQRVDVQIAARPGALQNFTNGDNVLALLWHEGYLWAGTSGGVVRWNPADESYVIFTTIDGLADNHVTAIAVGQDGALWFGTSGKGVSRYLPGGNPEWQRITTADGLASDHILDIASGPDGALWFATNNGVSQYRPGNSPEWYTFTTTDGLMSNNVIAIALGPDEAIWFAHGDGLSRYLSNGDPQWQTFSVTDVYAIAVGPNGALWAGTLASGVSQYIPGESPEWRIFTTADGLASDNICFMAPCHAITVESDGTVWIGTADAGVSRYRVGDNSEWQTFTTADGLAGSEVVVSKVGPDGELWFGTWGGGLSRYTSGSIREWQTYMTVHGLVNNEVNVIATGPDGTIWIANGNIALSRYDPDYTPEWHSFTTEDGLVNGSIKAMAVGPEGVLWIGTPSGLSRYTPDETPPWHTFTTADGLVSNDVRGIAIAPDGVLWCGTTSGVSRYTRRDTYDEWHTFTTADGLASNSVGQVAVGLDGSVWFETAAGVSLYTPGITPTWHTFTTADGLASNNIVGIVVEPDGSVWFGTYDSGVSHYTPNLTPSWKTYTTAHGLASRYIQDIAIGVDGALWVGTSGDGVSRYKAGDNPEWRTLTTSDGLANDYVMAVELELDGTLWFGTRGGITHWTTPIPQTDLTLTLYTLEAVRPGHVLTYTAQVSNQGTLTATHITLTLTHPVNTTFLSATVMPSNTTPLIWDLGALAPGAAITLEVATAITLTAAPGAWLTAVAEVATTVPESFRANNTAQASTYLRDPDRADMQITAYGPPVLVAGAPATYTLCTDNAGGLTAQNVTVTANLPPEMVALNGMPAPLTLAPPTWALGDLAWDSAPVCLILTAGVAPTVTAGTWLTLTTYVTTTTFPDPVPANNTATVALPTTLDNTLTLILTAPERMLQRYGATPLETTLYALTQHPRVRGVVVNVLQDPAVRAAYAAWDAEPLNVARAQVVANAIKALIDAYTITYPHLRYLVIAGGDDIIPFYRVRDRNPTMWQESHYASQTPHATPLWAALTENYFLTDDFYAARSATLPPSEFWTPGVPFFIPDFALGRLVETPVEIQAAIETFLAYDGVTPLGPALIGAEHTLTADGAEAICQTVIGDGLTATCTQHPDTFKTSALTLDAGSIWAAWHSDYSNLGTLRAAEISARAVGWGQTMIASIGCHSGLNVLPGLGRPSPLDLPQAIGGRGGVYVAPTAYAYAVRLGIGYSEALWLEFSQRVVLTTTQEIGPALVHAKQAYYAAHPWFDHLDEKVMSGMTLYGLPMARVASSGDEPRAVLASLGSSQPQITVSDDTAVLTYTLSGLTYTLNTTPDGAYWEYQGATLVQDGLPVQPAFTQSLPATVQERTPRGVWLFSAAYTTTAFDPVIAQGWAIGAPRALQQVEPPVILQGWDRPLPYALGRFEGLHDTQAALNLVLGAYNADTQVEQLFTALILAVQYSDSADVTPPVIMQSTSRAGNGIRFQAEVTDESGVAAVAAVCDDGQSRWTTIQLTSADGETWQGNAAAPCMRFYLQAVDTHSNIAVGAWQPTATFIEQRLYLPLVLRQQQ